MPKPLRTLTALPAMDKATGELTVIVETPKGSRSKYAYDPECGAYQLKFVLPQTMAFPVDFGFVPSTLGQDGDPLDVVLLLDERLAVGTKVSCRLIGAIKAKERAQGGEWERNDRLLAVAIHAHAFEQWHAMADVPSDFLGEIEAFFESYNRLHGKDFRVSDRLNRGPAEKLLRKGMKRFRKAQSRV
jgi:inorganic pyrophosphatase